MQECFLYSFCSQGPVIRAGFLLDLQYNVWQDSRIRTRIAATAPRCATNELCNMHIPCSKLDKMETIKSLKKNNIKLFQFNSPLLMYHGLEPGPLRCLLFYFTIHYPEAACSWRLEQGCGNDNYPIWQLSVIIRVVAIIILVLTPSPLVIYYLA